MDLIYNQLEQFVSSMKYILALVPRTSDLELVGQYFPLRVEANILVSNGDSYYFMVSADGGYIKHGTRPVALMTLKSDHQTWLQILNGHKSLMQEYNRGTVQMSNARANFMYKIIFLGILFETRTRLVRTGRIVRILPSSMLRVLLMNFLPYTHIILNRIPASVMNSFLNLSERLSKRLEK